MLTLLSLVLASFSQVTLAEHVADESAQTNRVSQILAEKNGASIKAFFLEDAAHRLNVEDVVRNQGNTLFEPLSGKTNFGFSTSNWWVRLRLTNDTANAETLYLRQSYPLIDHFSAWQLDDDQPLRLFRSGDREPFASRNIQHHDFVLPIPLRANESKTIILKYASDGPINIDLSVYGQQAIFETITTEQLFYGAYYGGFFVLAIYNMFLFAAARQRTYIYYLWYLVSYGVYMSVHNGFAFQYLWPNNPWLANQSLLILLSLSIYWGLRFSADILAIERIAPRLYRIADYIGYLTLVVLGLSFFLSYKTLIIPVSLLTLLITVFILLMGGRAMTARYKPAFYFMLAWSTLLVAVIIYMLKTFGFLPHNGFTQNAFQIASLVEMTLLSIALSHHFSELKKQTFTDALTQLFNRRHFDKKFSEEFLAAKDKDKQLSLMVLDIDHFKQFNDQFGHDKGDEIIQFVARTIKDNVRKPMVPCRYGGEEFAVILPRSKLDLAKTIAERIRTKVESESDDAYPVTVSVGVSNLATAGCQTLDEFFKSADAALYQAKRAGRNQVVTV